MRRRAKRTCSKKAAARSRTARAAGRAYARMLRRGEGTNGAAGVTQREGVGQDAELAPALEPLDEEEVVATVTHLLRRHDVAPASDQTHRRRLPQLSDRASHV